MMIFHLKRKKNISQVQAFVGLFNAALSPVACAVRACAVVSSECRVFDMRVNNVAAGKCSVCVFTAPRTP